MSHVHFDIIRERYRRIVTAAHPGTTDWPIITGFNVVHATYKGAYIMHLKDTGFSGSIAWNDPPELSREAVGVDKITRENRESVIARLEAYYRTSPRDIVLAFEDVIEGAALNFDRCSSLDDQLRDALLKHELVLGFRSMRVFLSHKGVDKPKVRQYADTLRLLGFDPWLDEDAMPAGTSLERGILKGLNDSAAAVFFVTPSYIDENYLATEVEYAIAEKRKKGDRFAIITLVFHETDKKGSVPDLLHPYVWKEPTNELHGLREILKALPMKVGPVRWG